MLVGLVVIQSVIAGVATAGTPDAGARSETASVAEPAMNADHGTDRDPEAGNESDGGPPPGGPDHGVNATTWWKLWSGDADTPALNYTDIGTVTNGTEAARQLANASDFVFDRPPKAVDTWNRGEHDEWNGTGPNRSMVPPNTTLSDGEDGVITDAYVETIAFSPSTVVHHRNTTDRWIGQNGRVHLMIDYRVSLPENSSERVTRGNSTVYRQTNWTLVSSSIGDTTFTSGTVEFGATEGEHAPAFEYQNVRPKYDGNQSRTFTAESRLQATLVQINRTCPDYNASNETCNTAWAVRVEEQTYNHTVSDETTVKVQILDEVQALQYTYRDSDWAGIHVDIAEPWRGIRVTENELARSSWWFYTRQRPGWSTMTVTTGQRERTVSSPIRLLDVHAIPAEYRPSIVPNSSGNASPTSGQLQLATLTNDTQTAPTLDENINVEVAGQYETVREAQLSSLRYGPPNFRTVTVYGVVRNTSQQRSSVPLASVSNIHSIDVDILQENASTLTLQITVWGEQVNGRPSYPIDRGQITAGSVSTTIGAESGPFVTLTIPKPDGPVQIRFRQRLQPGQRNYADASTTINEDKGSFPSLEELLYILWAFVPTIITLGLFVYGLDYLTDGRLLGRNNSRQ